MKRTWIVLALVAWLVLLLLLAATGESRHGHGHRPTPTPSPTATPVPTPTATPTPSPSPTPTPPTVTLAWDASANATGYHLWLGFAPGAEAQSTDEGNVLQATVQLTSGTTYYFVVTAYDAGGDSLPSNEVSYTAP